ncbi:MAG: hypothetical protein HFG56_01115 [Lachnospiraceae bacterium]|nr:hypothetical protein [Lachnospiraceae bacterium]
MGRARPERVWNYRRMLAGFFILMLFCTIVSRIYDSVTVPKVITGRAKEKTVETLVTGTGTVREQEVFFSPVIPGLRVWSVVAEPGKQVKKGEELFCYGKESMREQKEKLEQELEKLRLELEKEEISREEYDSVTESELASWELAMAKQEWAKGQQEWQKQQQEAAAKQEQLQQDYERKRTMAKEELWEQQNQEEENTRQELSSAKNTRNSELRKAQRMVADLEMELAELASQNAEEKEIAKKEQELARAREDKEELEEEWEDRISDVEVQLDLIDDRNERIRSGSTSSQLALLEAYEEELRQLKERQKEEEKKLEEWEKRVERAQWDLEVAQRKDEYGRLTREQKNRLSKLTEEGLLLDIRIKEQELEKLEKLLAAEGKVLADRDGTVVKVELLAGKTTTGEECLTVASGDFCFEGEFEKEEQKMAVGDRLQLAFPGSSEKREVKIEEMNLLGEEKGIFRARLMGEEFPLGMVTSYECRKQSEIFRQVIPLQGLRKDMKGYHCLVVRPKRAILGEEFVAERVEVRVLELGNMEAAVEGALQNSDEIIVRSNQVIGEGMRVRPVNE